MSRFLTDSLSHAYAKCENCHLCSINDHFSKTKTFCFLNQNPLDNIRYQLVFTKFHVFLWVENFRGVTAGFTRLPTFSRNFIAGYIYLTKNTEFFTRGGIYPSLLYPTHVFFISFFILCNRETRFGRCPILPSPPSNTKHNVDLPCTQDIPLNTKHSVNLPTMHSHPFNVISPCICNARCHCMLYHVTCIMNATWTTQSTLTGVMDNHITCI